MRLQIGIAWRFLVAKRRAMVMSLAGITFGVAFFILFQAQSSGFERFFIDTILGINGGLRVQDRFQYSITEMQPAGEAGATDFSIRLREGSRYIPGVQRPEPMLETLRSFHAVTGASPVLRADARIRSGFREEPGRVLGIDPASYVTVSSLATQILFGDLRAFEEDRQGILIGRRLAERLNVRLEETVRLEYLGQTRRYTVQGIFETGVDVYDKSHFMVHLEEARLLLAEPTAATYIQVAIRDPDAAPALAEQLRHTLWHYVASWQEREKSWLALFQVMRFSTALTMSIIILIAGLGMFNTLAVIVIERAREIAILRSTGFTRGDISQIFLWQGLLVYLMGSGLGIVLGALLTRLAELIPIPIRGIFKTDHFIVHWSPWHYVAALLVSGLIVLFAAVIPARRAARVEPADVIRMTAG